MQQTNKIFVAGHRGLVGSAIVRALQKNGFNNLLLRGREEVDLTEQQQVNALFAQEKPDYVFLAAAKVGGIQANNDLRGDFIYQNLAIQTHVIEAARRYKVKRLLFLGSSCIYPQQCPQPIKEEYLLRGTLEPTNEPYAIAKIAGIKLCESYNYQYGTDFVSVMPTNLYGPGDNFDLNSSHVLPALLRKTHEAKIKKEKQLTVWGTGTPLREFLHVDDMASACLFIMKNKSPQTLFNIGSGEEYSIRQLAELICKVVGFECELLFDHSKPDGVVRKLVDTSRLHQLGWSSTISLEEGLTRVYAWYKNSFLASCS